MVRKSPWLAQRKVFAWTAGPAASTPAASSAAMAKRRIDVLLVGLDAGKTGHHA